MAIKSHYDTKVRYYYVIKIHTLLTTELILIIRMFLLSSISFLAEKLLLNKDKGEVMHNEETI